MATVQAESGGGLANPPKSVRDQRPREVGPRIGAVLASHTMLDAYAAILPASLVILESRCGLLKEQTAWLLGVGPLFSGASQPIIAWISDRFDSRLFTGLGLAVCAAALCLIGFAHSYLTLLAIYIPAMIAAGAYHPVSAASVGQLGGNRRSLATSAFFVAGMIGGSTGSYFAPRFLASAHGFSYLPYLMIPGIFFAAVAYFAVAKVPHRATPRSAAPRSTHDSAARWTMVTLLYISAAIRFSVNMALVYLFARWLEQTVALAQTDWNAAQIANEAAPGVGSLVAAMIAGMGIGGVLSGFLVAAGREKWPLVLVPMMFAPAVWLLPELQAPWTYLASALGGVGFAAMVPVSLAVAQRLLPLQTSLASGLMLGGAWAVSGLGPRLAQWGLANWGLVTTFHATAIALAISGLVALPLRASLIRSSTCITEYARA